MIGSKSLKTKLLIGFLCVGLIPSIVLQINSYYLGEKSNDSINKQAQAIAVEIGDKIDRNLFERYGDVQAFGFNTIVQDRDNWYRRGATENPIVVSMNNYVVAYGMYYLTTLVDLQGKVIAVNDVDRAGKPIDTTKLYSENHADQKWFQDAVNEKFYTAEGALSGTVVDDIYVDPTVKEVYGDEGLALGFTSPVKDVDGNVVAIWHNTARFDLVEAVIIDSWANLERQGYKSYNIQLIQNTGTVIASYDPITTGTKEFKRDMGQLLKTNLIEKNFEAARLAAGGETGVTGSKHLTRDSNQVTGFTKLRGALGFIGMPWSVLVSADESELHAAVDQSAKLAVVIFGLCLLGITFAVWVSIKGIAKPIEKIIGGLQAGSRELRSAASQVAASSQSLAQGATEQAASLEESSAGLEEISSVSKQTADNSQQAFQLSEDARSASQAGVQSMDGMTTAMNSIKKAAEETAEIIKIIDDIAFQTNLLALNAAVEAARAGDAGKGFAVVAEEVRNLAQRSAKAAQETSAKIKQSKDLAENGVRVMQDVARSLDNIKTNAVKSADLVKEIAAASKEQTTGIGHINQAVAELDKVTQQNSAAAEESSAAAEELTAQAATLDEVVQSLSKVVYGMGKNGSEISVAEHATPTHAPITPPQTRRAVSPKKRSASTTGNGKPEEIINLKPSQIIPLDDSDFQGF